MSRDDEYRPRPRSAKPEAWRQRQRKSRSERAVHNAGGIVDHDPGDEDRS